MDDITFTAVSTEALSLSTSDAESAAIGAADPANSKLVVKVRLYADVDILYGVGGASHVPLAAGLTEHIDVPAGSTIRAKAREAPEVTSYLFATILKKIF